MRCRDRLAEKDKSKQKHNKTIEETSRKKYVGCVFILRGTKGLRKMAIRFNSARVESGNQKLQKKTSTLIPDALLK